MDVLYRMVGVRAEPTDRSVVRRHRPPHVVVAVATNTASVNPRRGAASTFEGREKGLRRTETVHQGCCRVNPRPRRRRRGNFLGIRPAFVTDQMNNFTTIEKLTLTITTEAATCGEFAVFDTHLIRASTIDRK